MGGPFDLALTRLFPVYQPDPVHTLRQIAELLRPAAGSSRRSRCTTRRPGPSLICRPWIRTGNCFTGWSKGSARQPRRSSNCPCQPLPPACRLSGWTGPSSSTIRSGIRDSRRVAGGGPGTRHRGGPGGRGRDRRAGQRPAGRRERRLPVGDWAVLPRSDTAQTRWRRDRAGRRNRVVAAPARPAGTPGPGS